MGLEALLERYVADGHEPAIAELVRRTRPRLLAVARRIGAPQDAEDSVQAAYLSLVRQRAIRAPVLPWLVTAVVRTAYAAKAARARQAGLAEKLSRIPREEMLSAADGAERTEEAGRLRRFVDQLPAHYRDVAVLHYFQGLATPEVAALLCITEAAVRKRLERARLLLRTQMDARIAGLFLAIPWCFEDAALAAWGGIAVKKTLSLVVVALLLCVGAATVAILDARRAPETPRYTRVEHVPPPAAEPTAVPEPAAPERPRFFGAVVDAAGRPVAGALVEVRKHLEKWEGTYYTHSEDEDPVARLHARSGSDGRFEIDPPGDPAAALELHASADGYPRAIVRALPGAETRIVLHEAGGIRVVVRDEAEGPVPGATVFLCYGKDPLQRRPHYRHPVVEKQPTDERGEASFAIAPGPYVVLVRAEGLTPHYGKPFAVAAHENVQVDVVLGPGTVAEVLVKDEGGAPVAGAEVELMGPLESGTRKQTDEKGRCRIAGIAAPDVDMDYWHKRMWWEVTAPGYAMAEGSRPITERAGTERIDITLARGVPVRIRAIDAEGRPVQGVQVHGSYWLNAAKPMQTGFGDDTDADGWADLGRFLPGQRTVHVVDRGFETQSLEIVVRLEPFEQVLTLVRTDGSLSGTVLDPDGDLVRGGQVGFASEGATLGAALRAIQWPIGEDGSFKIEHLPAASGHVWVMADGFAAQRMLVPFAPAGRTEGFVARLEARGTVRGRLVTREGEPVPSLAVHLRQDIALGNDAHSVALVARTVSGADGVFEFRGVADEDYRVSARDAEWIMVESLLKVSADDLDVVVRMKPAREGSGIRVTLSVPPADDGTPVPGPIGVEYRAEERPWAMTPGPKLDGDLWQFGFHSKPGRYDLTVHCVGFLPCEIRGVTIEDRPDPPPILARFRRGGVVRLRALDESGAPLRGISVSAGNLLLRTDGNGECEVSGLEPKEQELRLELVGEQYVFGVARVRPPGRADVTIRKYGYVRVILTDRVYGDLEEKLMWRLLDEQDRVVDESVFDLSEIGKWYARDRKIEGWLKAAAKGSYRVSVEMDGERMEAPVEIVPGERAVLGIPPR